jgi:hypothetical protein
VRRRNFGGSAWRRPAPSHFYRPAR